MKKFTLLTFGLLMGLTLSAQTPFVHETMLKARGEKSLALKKLPVSNNLFASMQQTSKVSAASEDSIIYSTPKGTLWDSYSRTGIGWYYSYGSGFATPYYAYVSQVVRDGDTYYFLNPFNCKETGSWIKGTRTGDTISVMTPQPVMTFTDSENNDSVMTLYAHRLVWNADSSGFKVDTLADGTINNRITYVVHGDSIIQTDGGQLALTDSKGGWLGYGDEQVTYALVKDKEVEAPKNVTFNNYMLSYSTVDDDADTLMARVGFDGSDVYMTDFYGNIHSYIKGTRNGNKITFPSGQYLGANSYYKSHLYFFGVTPVKAYDPEFDESYTDLKLNDKVVFTLNDDNSLTSDSSYVINAGNEVLYYINSFMKPTLKPYTLKPLAPTAPYNLSGDLSNDPLSGQNYISFYLDKIDPNGNFLDPDSLYYQLMTQSTDASEPVPFTFYADSYEGLGGDTDIIPYSFFNNSSIVSSYNQREIVLVDAIDGKIGVRSVYRVNGVTNTSATVWFVPDGISRINGEGKLIRKQEYYDLSGRHVSKPTRGFYLLKTTFTDGHQVTKKISLTR